MLLPIALLLALTTHAPAREDPRPLPAGKSKVEVVVGSTALEVETFKPAH